MHLDAAPAAGQGVHSDSLTSVRRRRRGGRLSSRLSTEASEGPSSVSLSSSSCCPSLRCQAARLSSELLTPPQSRARRPTQWSSASPRRSTDRCTGSRSLEKTTAAGGDRQGLATPGVDVAEFPAFSPDGGQVAFTGWRQDGDDTAVYIVGYRRRRRATPDARGRRRPTGRCGRPTAGRSCSPLRVRARETLFTVSSHGGRMHRVTPSSRRLRFPAWSPDGKRIVCESYDNHGDSELVVMRADGTRIEADHRGCQPRVSPHQRDLP